MPNKKGKIWQAYPGLPAESRIKNPDLSEIVLQLLYNRGIAEKGEIKKFLEPDFQKDTFDPFLFNDMEEAVSLIVRHIKGKSRIFIYGDYDADGVTSSALLFELFRSFNAKAEVYIPDRVEEGYGLNGEALKYIREQGAGLVITVDCGIRSVNEIASARKDGLDIIVTDHHLPPEELPDCPVINPSVKGENYPYKYLAGVGVAYKLAKALVIKSKLPDNLKSAVENRMMDLVAIGTVADCVPLLGENRVLVKKGLEILNATKRIGLVELIKISGLANSKLDSWNIGFQLAPRLNAAGRMDHANSAFRLLSATGPEEAAVLAQELNARNVERQKNTEEIFLNALGSIDEKNLPEIIISVSDKKGEEAWNEGVIGLVAGKLASRFYRPALVITKGGDGFKGSGRSIPEMDIVSALSECSSALSRYGGHPAACGFSFSDDMLEKFRDLITKEARKRLGKADLRPKILIEKDISISEIDEDLIREIERIAPFGQKNEKPIFSSRGVYVVDKQLMGSDKQHLKLRLKCEIPGLIYAIGFGQAEKWSDVEIGNKIDIAFYLDVNEFNGRKEVQMKIVDIARNA